MCYALSPGEYRARAREGTVPLRARLADPGQVAGVGARTLPERDHRV
jgi:hypothetical protein